MTTEIYTKSGLIDKIVEEFKSDADLEKTINGLPYQKATLSINPFKYPTLLEVSSSTPDEVQIYVRDAILQVLREYSVPQQTLKYVEKNFNLKLIFDETIPLDRLTATYENTIVQTIAQVVTVGRRESYIKEIRYECKSCNAKESRRLEELECHLCHQKMKPIETIYGDTIMVEIQQPYDEIIVQPSPYHAQFFDEDVFTVKIGDIKKLVLIRKSGIKKNKPNRVITLHVLSATDVALKAPKLPDEDLKNKLHELAKSDGYIDYISKCAVPQVLYQDLAKVGCILSIIGGKPTTGIRSIIHCMLCGDPSEAKTTILKWFTKLPYQKTGYAVGSQASGQGITVAMSKLGDGTSYPRAGLLTLCTGGYVAIDEHNLMKEEELDKTRECAEDGELSYNKGGFNLKLIADTTILSGLNPRWHHYDFDKPMKDNLNMPVPLLSRLDIKVNITSPKDISREKRIIEHIYSYKQDGMTKHIEDDSLLSAEQFSLMINYARTFHPTTPPEIQKMLIDYYIEQKSLEYSENTEEKGLLRIDRRTGRTLLLLAEAFARWHFSETVTEYHARLAIKFAKDCIKTFGFDPEKGLVQTSLREADFNPKTAFEYACQTLESRNDDNMFSESELTKELLDKFPAIFKHDYQVHEQWQKFNDLGRMSYRGGRYKIV